MLTRTTTSPIYQNENRADKLKFLISIDNLSVFNIGDSNCMLCVILPNGQEGKFTFLNFENVLYRNKYLVAYVPITKAFTKLPGTLSINLIFSYEDSNKLFHYLPTNDISMNILKSSSSDSFIDPDETSNPFTEMVQKIESLEKSKISSMDIDGHAVHIYADTEKTILIGTINLPEEVVWTTMEDM